MRRDHIFRYGRCPCEVEPTGEYGRYKKAGYFLTPKAEYSVLYCIKALMRKGYTVRILTAYYTGGSAMAEKQEWLQKLGLGSIEAIFVPCGVPKHLYVDSAHKNVLIDDYTHNLKEWVKSGNFGIKFRNKINCKNGTWTGAVVDYRSTSLARDIESFIK